MTALPTEDPDLIAAGWRRVRPGAFVDLIGPFYMREDEDGLRFCFRAADKHDNTQARPHGGMIMSFLDDILGLSAYRARPDDLLFTVTFDCQFIGASSFGDLIVAETRVVSATRSLIFMRGECKVDDRIIASASGVWKVLNRARVQP